MNVSSPLFQLFWLRESGCDAGTPVSAAELPAPVRERVLELARCEPVAAPATWMLRLPYLDRLDERHQDEVLAGLEFERCGNLIRCVLPPAMATKDAAATCALADPVWRVAPGERDPDYFVTWQRVSMALQRWVRDQVAGAYFADLGRLEDRAACYPMIVYQAARPFFGRPRSEFTYDLRDFPWCEDTLAASWKLTGRHIQRVMAGLEDRLHEAGNAALARKYSPVWHQDVLVAVQRKPKVYAELLARESAIINAVIDLGTQPKAATIDRSVKIMNRQLRRMHGLDLRGLGAQIFEVATEALSKRVAGGSEDLANAGPEQDACVGTSGRPDSRIGA